MGPRFLATGAGALALVRIERGRTSIAPLLYPRRAATGTFLVEVPPICRGSPGRETGLQNQSLRVRILSCMLSLVELAPLRQCGGLTQRAWEGFWVMLGLLLANSRMAGLFRGRTKSVVRLAVNQKDVGSNPTLGAKRFPERFPSGLAPRRVTATDEVAATVAGAKVYRTYPEQTREGPVLADAGGKSELRRAGCWRSVLRPREPSGATWRYSQQRRTDSVRVKRGSPPGATSCRAWPARPIRPGWGLRRMTVPEQNSAYTRLQLCLLVCVSPRPHESPA